MTKKWVLCETDKDKIENISTQYGISQLLAHILINREITNESELNIFLNPTRKDFYDPFLLPDMDKSVARILKAIEKNERVIIYGDYDVDGITSITVLKKFLADRRTCCRVLYTK
jgi:single-stranded-DNA-specific exonuclease